MCNCYATINNMINLSKQIKRLSVSPAMNQWAELNSMIARLPESSVMKQWAELSQMITRLPETPVMKQWAEVKEIIARWSANQKTIFDSKQNISDFTDINVSLDNNIDSVNIIQSTFETITEKYISDTNIDDVKATDEIRAVTNNLFLEEQILNNLTPKQEKFFREYIYPFLLMLIPIIIGFILQKPSVTDNTYTSNNSIAYVNNYYVVQEGYSKEFLNDNNLRIINIDKVIIRKKHDCSSTVITRLAIGKVVCVVDKYKKWIKITWRDDNGKYYCGWLQNYKLSEFR